MKNNILISDLENYTDIVDSICREGKENVHILADFDKTLTKAFIKGEAFPSLIAILRNDTSILGEEYAKKAHALYDHYSVIEKDPTVSNANKVEIMSEWWRKHQALLVKSGLTREHIKMAVNSGYLEFREGMEDFIKILAEKEIPLVIISANGIGTDSIRMFFEKHNLMSNTIHIISNELEFDENGITCGFKKTVIHSFNKSEAVLSDYPEIHSKVATRKNILLLGDGLGDPQMIDGFEYDNLLKIGFFNNRPDIKVEGEQEKLDHFRQIFDLVLTGDSSMGEINTLLSKIK